MHTPTFPEPPLNGDEAAAVETPPPPIAETIDALRQGPVRATEVARLSDLGREDARAVGGAWPSLPEETRIAVVRAMGELAEERVDLAFGRVLRLALDDASAAVRQLAVAALWEDDRRDLLERFRQLAVHDPSQDVRAEAAAALGRFADQAVSGELDEEASEELRGTLTELAEDVGTPHGVRRRALESVGVFGREESVRRVILDAYDEDDQGLRGSALYAMGRSLDPRWLGTILDDLESPEAELRYEAARAAGALGDDGAVPDLGQLALDPDVEVRHAAIAALGEIGGRAALRVLRALAEEPEEADADAIDAALEEAVGAAEGGRGGGAH